MEDHSQSAVQQPNEKVACLFGEGADRHVKKIIRAGGSALSRNMDFNERKLSWENSGSRECDFGLKCLSLSVHGNISSVSRLLWIEK